MEKIIELNDILVNVKNGVILDQNNVKISINAGDKIAVIGKNGSGKSTLVNVLLNEINYSGVNISNLTSNDIGVVFQQNEYIDLLKVSELIQLVINKKKSTNEYKMFVEKFFLQNLENSYVKSLSGGERQKLTVALVIYQNKKMYIFDELTTGLDYEKRKMLMSMIKKETSCSTVINVTHYFEEVESWVNKVLILHCGKVLYFDFVDNLHDRANYYSSFEIMSEVDCENIFINVGLIFDENKIISFSKEENEKIIEILTSNNVKYFEKGRHLYATYFLLVGKVDV